ncbi:tetratricopeptide repeat protein [uncultured Aquimarina sp.]|uniref:tetratricopeptide repeat protein n=1 Tax=uncultured Aquimarina sp. TaxID=575652 RepID=UPI0026270479|nr:tetratricopeptide repeat protein [uncultured Aquimarina sp.]
MEKFKTFCLSIFCAALLMSSCSQQPQLYKKEFDETESKKYAKQFIEGLKGPTYQGSPEEHFLIEEAKIFDPTFSDIYREMGASRVKRGVNTEAMKKYAKAVSLDPESWQGYRGYLYLYFYRDYDNAIKDFDELDALTPNFVDYPQSENIDFMRGIAYMMKKDYPRAQEYFKKFFEHESKSGDLNYIESRAFMYYGITYFETGDLEKALEKFDLGIKHNKNADLFYWKAKTMKALHRKQSGIIKYLEISKELLSQGYNSRRPYVEEFYQTYIEDIEELGNSI